jgi:hypothetical protein
MVSGQETKWLPECKIRARRFFNRPDNGFNAILGMPC